METPYFFIHRDILDENIASFKKGLEQEWGSYRLAYSVKTNALPYVLSCMKKQGIMAEVVSDDEYNLARLCGFAPEEIVFNGPIKGKELFLEAVQQGSLVHLDSRRELEWLWELPEGRVYPVGLRVNLDLSRMCPEDVGLMGEGYRFGFSYENGDLCWALDKLSACPKVRLQGFHFHCNSITRNPAVYGFMAQKAGEIIRRYGLSPEYIDMGGGFFGGVPGKPAPEVYVRTIAEQLEGIVDTAKVQLLIEPGSAFIGSAVDFVTTVLDVKENPYGRIVTTDGGRVNLDPLWKKERYLFERTGEEREQVPLQIVCGYTCMDHDRIMRLQDAPAFEVGDRIVYKRVGAYTMTFEGMFIRRHPPVYAQEGDALRLVRQTPSLATMAGVLGLEEEA